MRPILEEESHDFHNYSQRPIQISESSKRPKEGVESGAKITLSSTDFVLSFKINLRKDPVAARGEMTHEQHLLGIPSRDEL